MLYLNSTSKFLLVMLCLAAVACSKSSESSPQAANLNEPDAFANLDCGPGEFVGSGIVAGKNVNADSWLAKSTVFIMSRIENSDSVDLCTGSLIAKDLVLTAAHCVEPFKDNFKSVVHVMFDSTPLCSYRTGKVSLAEVDKLVIHPRYKKSEMIAGDMALLHLSVNAPSWTKPLKIPKKKFDGIENKKLFAVGYGTTLDYQKSDLNHRLRVTELANLSDEQTIKIMKSLWLSKVKSDVKPENDLEVENLGNIEKSDLIFLDQRFGTGICSGDSGGPAILQFDNKNYIFGVASSVMGLDESGKICGSGVAIYSNVIRYRPWIEKNMRQMSRDPAVEPEKKKALKGEPSDQP